MSGTEGRLQIKRVELGDEFVIFMPASWAWGQLNDGRWWCGDRDDRFLCELHHEIAPPRPVSGDDEATPLANARYRLDALRRFLEQQGTLGDTVQSKTLSGGILHAIIDEEEESGTYRAAKWFAVTGYSRGVSIFRINLTAAVEHWNAPIRSELIDLFSEQAEFGTGYTAPSNLGLRDLRLAPAIIFRVPEELRAMSIDGSFPHVPRAEYVLHVAERFVRTLAVSTVLRPVELTLYGALVTTELPGNPNPDETGTIWYYLIPRPEGCVIITFTLDTQSTMRDRSEFAEAKALLARQIANLRLELEDARDE